MGNRHRGIEVFLIGSAKQGHEIDRLLKETPRDIDVDAVGTLKYNGGKRFSRLHNGNIGLDSLRTLDGPNRILVGNEG
jgi:hypothetical protein